MRTRAVMLSALTLGTLALVPATAGTATAAAPVASAAQAGDGTYQTFNLVATPAPTVTKNDPTLPAGTTKKVPGKPGVTKQVDVVVVQDGRTVSRTPQAPQVVTAPTPTVVLKGTKPAERASRSSDRKSLSGGNAIVSAALAQVGDAYVWGANGTNAWDCSSLTQYAYRQAGISLPRQSDAQASRGHRVSRSEARPGDLVYRPGHVGIYLGDGRKVHASSPSTGVIVSSLTSRDQIIRIS
jgi:cell wall-associated NlpC family hydrolase